MGAGQVAQGRRQGEGHQEVWHWEQEILLPRAPRLRRIVLPGRAMPILARVVAVAGDRAGWARVEVPTQRVGATGCTRGQRRAMTGQQPISLLGPVGWPRAPDNGVERDHGMPAVSWSSAAVAKCAVLRVQWVSIAVVVSEE